MAAVETAPVVVEISARLSETCCDPVVTTPLIYKDSNVKESTILKLSEMGID